MKYAIYALPILLATLFGLIFTGVIHIPGVSPEKKKAAASGAYADATDEKPESETESDAAQKAEPPEGKPEEAKSQTDSQKPPPEDPAVPPPAATAASSATPATASPQSATADEAPSDPLSGQRRWQSSGTPWRPRRSSRSWRIGRTTTSPFNCL